MTSRGCLESDFEAIADFLYRAAQIASAVQRDHVKLQKEFLRGFTIRKMWLISGIGLRHLPLILLCQDLILEDL